MTCSNLLKLNIISSMLSQARSARATFIYLNYLQNCDTN